MPQRTRSRRPVPDAIALLLERSPCDVALLAGAAPPAFADGVAVALRGWRPRLGRRRARGLARRRRVRAAAAGRRPGPRRRRRREQAPRVGVHRHPAGRGRRRRARARGRGARRRSCGRGSAGVVVVGLSPRWRREGLGASRRALLAAGTPTLLVHRGARPGGLAPRERLTRFTWTPRRGRLISRAGRARRGRRR